MRVLDLGSGRAGLLSLALLLGGHMAVRASGFTLDLGQSFNGEAPASSEAPWVEAVFQDIGPGTVRLTVSNLNLTANENVAMLYLNLNPKLNPATLSFQLESGSGSFTAPSITTGANAYLGRSLHFNISLGFANGHDTSKNFDGTDYFTEIISGTPSLKAADFDTSISQRGDSRTYYAAAEIDHIGSCGQSGWISADCSQNTAVPEPGAPTLLSAMVGTWLAYWAWKRARDGANSHQLKPIPIRRTDRPRTKQ